MCGMSCGWEQQIDTVGRPMSRLSPMTASKNRRPYKRGVEDLR
jgi:hypothetical protein